MRIGVTAATGQLGFEIVYSLKKEMGAENVVGLARRPERNRIKDVEFRKGDYNNKRQLLEGLRGLDLIVLIASNDDIINRFQQHVNVIDAAKDAGVQHVIYASIIGEENDSSFSNVIESNRLTEDYLIASGLTYTIGRNSLYIEPDLNYISKYIHDGKISNSAGPGRCAYTTRCELSKAYAKLASQKGHENLIYNLSGAAITQHEFTEAINRVFGTDIYYEYINNESYEAIQMKNLGKHLGSMIASVYQSIQLGHFNVDSDFEEIVGRKHKNIIQILEEFKNN